MQINSQAVEKLVQESDTLEIHSIFPTIQGEGPFVGQRATFIRFAGCNLQCPKCDTDYTSRRTVLTPNEVADVVVSVSPADTLVVITGGEPFRQPLDRLVAILLGCGFRVQIETNGTLYQELPYNTITVVCSPKTSKVHPKLAPHVDAWKYVVEAGKVSQVDGLPYRALDHIAEPLLFRPPLENRKPVYVQPVDDANTARNARNTSTAVESVMQHGHTLCLQTHKIIGVE